MKRIVLALGLLALVGGLGAGAASAQTRVSVSIGFGVPAPYVVYHARPYHYFYEPYPVVVYERPVYRRLPLVVARPRSVVIVRGHGRRHHHRHW